MSATPDPTEWLGERPAAQPRESTPGASEDPDATMNAGHRVDQSTVDAAEPIDVVDGTELPDGAPELPWEPATAYSIEGYDHDDPWNAVLCVEGQTTEIVLDLTPTHLDRLVAGLSDVRDAQRRALGAEPEEPDAAGHEPAAGFGRVTSAARVATGSAPVARLWNSGTNGRVIIVGGVALFVVLGVILSLVLQ